MCLRNYDKKATCLRKKEKCVFDLGTQETSLLRYAVRLLGSQLQAAKPIDCQLRVARLSKSRTLFIIEKFIFIAILRCSVGAIFVSPFLPLGRDHENAKTRCENAKQRCAILISRSRIVLSWGRDHENAKRCENAKKLWARERTMRRRDINIAPSHCTFAISQRIFAFSCSRCPEGETTKTRRHDARTRNNDARSRKYDARAWY